MGVTPKDCDWGSVALFPLAPSVSERAFNRAFAIWERGFASRYMTISLDEGGLVVEMVSIFKDSSLRSNMHSTAQMKRPR